MFRRRKGASGSRVRAVVKSELRSALERKILGYTTQHDVSTTGTAASICTPSQGSSITTRSGDMITPVRVWGRFKLSRDSGATSGTSMYVRVLIIRWKPNNLDDAPEDTEIFKDAADPFSQLTFVSADRSKFDVLYDRLVNLSDFSLEPSRATKALKVNIPLPASRKMFFNTGATTGTNQLYLITVGDKAIGTENCTLDPRLYIRYLDG